MSYKAVKIEDAFDFYLFFPDHMVLPLNPWN